MTFENTPQFRRGASKISAADLNTIVRMLFRQISGGSGINVRTFGDRIVVELSGTGAGPTAYNSPFKLYQVVEEDDDYVWCYPFNPTSGPNTSGEPIPVAKPYLLQRAPWDTQTVTLPLPANTANQTPGTPAQITQIQVTYAYTGVGVRTATSNVTIPVPPTYPGNTGNNTQNVQVKETQQITPPYFVGDILVAVQIGLGLTYEGTDSDGDPEELPVTYMDINTAARAWAFSPDDYNSANPPQNV